MIVRRIAAALGLMLWPTLAIAASERVYVVERVGEGISADDVIGPRRAGVMCLPSGRMHWRDLAAGGIADRKALVEDALEDAGLPILSTAPSPANRQFRIRALITEAKASLCARQQVFGDIHALSGTVSLVVEWRIEDVAAPGSPRLHVSAVERTYGANGAASGGSIGRALIQDAARDLASWLKIGAPGGPGAAADQ